MRPADDAFAEYIYATFPKDVNERCKVESLALRTEPFFDFRFHYTLKLKVKNEIQEFHVTLNESNVADTFFDSRIPVAVFGHKYFSAVYRFCESHFEDNEAPVKSVISTFDNQSFANQSECTGNARSFIKINGDSSEAGSLEMSKALADLSESSTLPVTFGRFARDIALTFANIDRTKGHKHDYIHVWVPDLSLHRSQK